MSESIPFDGSATRRLIHDLEQRFQVLADAMPQLVWSTLPDGHADYFNRGWCDFTGAPAATSCGEGWMQFVHPDDRAAAAQAWRGAVASGEAYEVEYRLRRADGEHRWMLARGLPMHDEAGKVSRWIGTCTDIQEQRASADQLALLTRELSHRIKNIFAVISGLITLSLRHHPDFAELGRELQDRVLALGRAHDFVRPQHGPGVARITHSSLRGMLDSLLKPYQTKAGERVTILGDDVRIDDRSATPLALFFHELATNAAKYGALTSVDGHVAIVIDAADAEVVTLSWTERGGPPARVPSAMGFGTTLVEMSVTRQLGGELTYDWHSEGLHVEARIPAQMMSR